MKTLLFLTLAVILVCTTFIACAQPASQPIPAPKTTPVPPSAPTGSKIMKFAWSMPKTGPVGAGWLWFTDQVDKKTNGTYKIDIYPGQTLFKDSESLNMLQAGAADFSQFSVSSWQQAFPVSNIVYLPSVHVPENKDGLAAARAAAKELMTKYPVMSSEFSKFKILCWNVGVGRRIITKKDKITIPDDVKGLRIGAQGTDQEIVKLAGGAPVNMVPPDMYQAFDKSVIDGAITGWPEVVSQRFDEVVNYYYDYPFAQNSQLVLMNLNSWSSLPPDIQKLMTDLVPEMESISGDALVAGNNDGRKAAQAKSRTVTTPTPEQKLVWDKLIEPLDNMWLDTMKQKGVTEAPAMLSLLKQRSAEAWNKYSK